MGLKALSQSSWLPHCICLLIAMSLSACGQSRDTNGKASEANLTARPPGVSEVVDAVCDKQVVMLGEGSNHVEGSSQAFKGDVIKALIKDCDFKLVLFEASFYEFARLDRMRDAGTKVSEADMRTALGFMWGYNAELDDMISYLKPTFNSGEIQIGGIDDQISGRGQDYSNFEMPREILANLPSRKKADCEAAIEKRILWQFPRDAPYNAAQKKQILNCLLPMNDSEDTSRSDTSERARWTEALRASLYRDFYRDQTSQPQQFAGRAESMYKNFEYWYRSEPTPPKTIVWAASVHTSKSEKILSVFGDSPNLGRYIKARFGDTAFALGFSALQGESADFQGNRSALPRVAEDALEREAFAKISGDVVFLEMPKLKRLGSRPGSVIGPNEAVNQDWSKLFDGIVVFREQKTATPHRPVSGG